MKRLFTDTGRILCIYRSGAIHEVMRNSYEFFIRYCKSYRKMHR